jgi:hypothetical protein
MKGRTTRVAQELEYELAQRGVLVRVTDRLFVRSQMRGSLECSLECFRYEVEELAAVARVARPGV